MSDDDCAYTARRARAQMIMLICYYATIKMSRPAMRTPRRAPMKRGAPYVCRCAAPLRDDESGEVRAAVDYFAPHPGGQVVKAVV